AVQVNDSTFTLTFSQQWTGHIYASLQGCTLFHDSIPVRVLQAPAQLNIGPDSVLCPGNTILLNARSGYASYLWQDGSSDSAFLVTEPGTYHVTTTDACGSTYRDTVRINPHAPIPLSIGPDRSKCNSDTIHLSATTGFLNYSWSPGYNINSTSLQQVVVNPSVDTIYTVMAEKTPGCFAYDTVRIRVYHSPAITLGADTSLCQGDTLFLDAGPGFSSWNWNTGLSGRHLQVSDAGNYFVTATTIDGCKSSDTIRVLNVFSLPQVQLNPDTTLCMGATRTLDAGNGFTNYLWSTGATTQTIPVSGTGIYAVIVTDQHLCTGTDTTRISTILPTPKDFLPGDTAICSYGQLQLSPLQTYPAYQWSTGSQQHSVTIAQPGVYWLQVIDASNCQGRDSITVNPKECLKGFYIPTGFTPNNDGRNDSFKPFIFGIVKQYRFSIYNRWGQLVFETRDLLKGWDGRLGGLPQDSNVYAWTCLYQLEGEPPKLEKGTVVLLR
ncbi:MAG TPA: gliding motility-associated C-terminal domain-containing protein, partial [Chitinophagaceae bacterium]|nr:gliding motility-associated C-terminal domain-containing protein [Chitinophagaceae bacterium]